MKAAQQPARCQAANLVQDIVLADISRRLRRIPTARERRFNVRKCVEAWCRYVTKFLRCLHAQILFVFFKDRACERLLRERQKSRRAISLADDINTKEFTNWFRFTHVKELTQLHPCSSTRVIFAARDEIIHIYNHLHATSAKCFIVNEFLARPTAPPTCTQQFRVTMIVPVEVRANQTVK